MVQKSKRRTSKKRPARRPASKRVAKKQPAKKPARPAKPITVPTDAEALDDFLALAIDKVDRPRIEAALAAGAKLDPVDGSQSALMYACYAETKHTPRSIARVKLLLELGADPTYRASQEKHRSALHELSFQPSLEILDALLARAKLDATADDVGNTPLHYAMPYCTDPRYWERLLELGNPLDTPNSLGQRPIHHAVEAGNHKAIEFLVARGASLDGTLELANDPKHYVAPKTIKLLEKLAGTMAR